MNKLQIHDNNLRKIIFMVALFAPFALFAQTLKKDEKSQKYGLSNERGKVIIPYIYDPCYTEFSEGLICVRKDKQCGYINTKGKEVIPFIYQGGRDFHNGLTWVCKEDKWGVIDKTGQEISPFKYDLNTLRSNDREHQHYDAVIYENMIITRSDNMIDGYGLEVKYGFDDIKGNVIVSPQFDEIKPFVGNVAIVMIGDHVEGKYGLIKKDGSLLIEPQYDLMLDFIKGTALIGTGNCREGKRCYGLINENGSIIVPPLYLEYRTLSDIGYALGNSDDNWAVFDFDGKKSIDYIDKVDKILYHWHIPTENNSYYGNCYEKDGFFGLLGQNGEILTKPIYEEPFTTYGDIDALIWEHGLLEIRRNGKIGYIDKSGKEVIPAIYQNLGHIGDWDWIKEDIESNSEISKCFVTLIPAKLNDKWGFVDTYGNVIIDFQYFEVEGFENSSVYDNKKPLTKVILNDGNFTEGYIDENGKFSIDENDLRQTIKP